MGLQLLIIVLSNLNKLKFKYWNLSQKEITGTAEIKLSRQVSKNTEVLF